MPIGILGDAGAGTIGAAHPEEFALVELRVISNLLQQQQGSLSLDELRVLRNDQAFELGIISPVPGN